MIAGLTPIGALVGALVIALVASLERLGGSVRGRQDRSGGIP